MVRNSRSIARRLRASARALRSAVTPISLDSLEQRRMLSAGDLDTTFNGTGYDNQPLDGQAQALTVALDNATGKIIVGATFNGNSPRIAVLRYLHNGSLDTTFGNNGVFTTQISASDEEETVSDVLVQGNQILVTGTATDDDTDDSDIYLMRLNDDGSIAHLDVFAQPGVQVASKMVLDGFGNLYIAGKSDDDSMVIKLDSTDTPVASFGIAGFAVNDLGSSEIIDDVALQANNPGDPGDDQLILAGSSSTAGGAMLARVNGSDGSLDTTYGDGSGVMGFANTDTYFAIAIGPDNGVYAATDDTVASHQVLAIFKQDSTGARDATFDGDGEANYDPGVGFDMTGAAITLSSGKLVVASSIFDETAGTYDIGVTRFDAGTGALDTAFGTAGLAKVNTNDIDLPTAVAIDTDGNIVLTGVSAPSDVSVTYALTARLLGANAVQSTPVHVDVNGDLIIPGTSGNDIFSVTASGTGVDVVYNGTDAGVFNFSGVIRITGLAGNDSITIDNAVTQNAIITGGAGDDTISGGGGNDSITGGAGNDVLSGQSGNDTLLGGAGNDCLVGGEGDDNLTGGADNDTAIGGNGNDSIVNDNGDDQLEGDAGNDTLRAGGGADLAHGGDGNDSLVGGTGNDTLYGDNDNDTIDGGAGNDFIDGGAGDDNLFGNAGSDIIVGGSGNDTIQGGLDRDILIGGTGRDSILGNADDDVMIAGSTSYDTDPASLNSALTEWTSADSYSTRVNSLSNSYFRTTGTITVFDDGNVDTLTGGAGTDWFLFNSDPGGVDIIDIKSGETGTDID